jgi:predicted metal-dependent hydrolase
VDVVRKKIKNLHFRVYPPDGRVRVSVPLRLSEASVRGAILSKLPWIETVQAKVQASQPLLQYVSGEQHFFCGKPYTLEVITTTTPRVVLSSTMLTLYVRVAMTTAQREQLLYGWYRAQMHSMLPTLIEKWQGIIGEPVSAWGIKRMKTRWGTCNPSSRRIWLNLELIKKPLHCLEYVVVHEIVHLLEASHNHRFKALMTKFLPQWRECRNQLKNGM